MKHVLVLLLAMLSGCAALNPLAYSEVDTTALYAKEYNKYVSWSHACQLTAMCEGVLMPEVVYDDNMREGLRGSFDGEGTIYINTKLNPGVDVQSTLIHEMIHHIHFENDLTSGRDEASVCWSESEAFRLVDLWLVSIGQEDKQRGPLWWKQYWHCEPYFDPEWDLWEWFWRSPFFVVITFGQD